MCLCDAVVVIRSVLQRALADRVRLYEKKKLKLKKVFNECSEYCASGHCARKYRGLVTEKKMLRRVLR